MQDAQKQKTFLLGFGAQKAASTWLVKYLAKQKGVKFGFAAKYHIWDVVDLKENGEFTLPRDTEGNPPHADAELAVVLLSLFFPNFEGG